MRKTVQVDADIKSKVQMLRIKWGLKSESDVIRELFERSKVNDDMLDNAVSFIRYIQESDLVEDINV